MLSNVSEPLIGVVNTAVIGQLPDPYYIYRIWSAPFAFANYCVMGWFIGQARAKLTFLVQLVLNLTNMALSATFVLWLGMTSDGVGLASLIAEIVAATLGLGLAFAS